MPKVDAELFFHIDEKNNQVDLTDKGINLITRAGEDTEFFILPDIATKLSDIDKGNLSPRKNFRARKHF
jgi:preprotein translocase subunit SecA